MPPTNAERFAPGLFLGELAQLSENLTKPPAESSPEVSIKAPPPGSPEVPSKSNGTTVNGTAANGAVAASAPVVAAKVTLDHAAECDPPLSEGPFSLLDPYCSREYREQFRLLRTQLMLHRSRFPQERDFQIVCVMSTHKGEGKSFTASNLAAVLAANGEKVLLIDADPRSKPTSIGLKLSEDAGLPNALATPAEWMKDVHRVKGTSLYVMARGTEKASHELKPTLPSRSWRELNLGAAAGFAGGIARAFRLDHCGRRGVCRVPRCAVAHVRDRWYAAGDFGKQLGLLRRAGIVGQHTSGAFRGRGVQQAHARIRIQTAAAYPSGTSSGIARGARRPLIYIRGSVERRFPRRPACSRNHRGMHWCRVRERS